MYEEFFIGLIIGFLGLIFLLGAFVEVSEFIKERNNERKEEMKKLIREILEEMK